MAAADLLVVISDPVLRWTRVLHFQGSFLFITPVCRLSTVARFATNTVSVWVTVAFTFDRFVAICFEKLKSKYCREGTAAVVIGAVSVLGCLESVPWFFLYEHVYIINNIPWYCVPSESFLRSFLWGAFEMFHFTLTPCAPFLLILLLNVLTTRRILTASRARRALRSRSDGEKVEDAELQNRRRSIILLFSISGSFILLWVTMVGQMFYVRITGNYVYTSISDPSFITEHVSTMLQLLSTCTNTCIYAVTQRKFRKQLMCAVTCPIKLVIRIFK
ncbi:probable G-protein coupled receptor 139 [Pristis pectinata]|uniref:probable G-protein coupled receptor 139 n=1 Tax=Pristis pectinata TaxID=685728 RepID=UPI00223D304C|nr:probable G-protein coupled receptor 139 [Pristis pectinata]